ncbi:MAG: hypothetical protein AB7L90_19035 [Hyphomicrobiaceae bacterium]
MVKMRVKWTDEEVGSTVDCGWLTAWVEPLLGEGAGRFSWSVDTPDASNPETLVNLLGGIEPSLAAAKQAAVEAMEFLGPAVKDPSSWIWPPRTIRSRDTSRRR